MKHKSYRRFLRYARNTIFITVLFALHFSYTLAAKCTDETKCLQNPIGATDIATLVARFIKTILPVLGTGALVMFIIGAIHWILSSGSPEKVKKGQDTLVWAVLGAAVAIGGYLALKFIFQVLTGNLKFT